MKAAAGFPHLARSLRERASVRFRSLGFRAFATGLDMGGARCYALPLWARSGLLPSLGFRAF
jgi:hypothetical protein